MRTGPAPARSPVLGAWIRTLRRARGISQADLATTIGCSTQYISLVELGLTRPTHDRLTALATVLGETVDALQRRSEPPPSGSPSDDVVDPNPSTRACMICSTPYTGRARRLYCSRRCRVAAYRRRQGAPGLVRERRTTCRQCGRDLPQPSLRVYCSNACTHQAWAARSRASARLRAPANQ